MSPLTQFFRRDGCERRLFLEALLCLAWAKILVHTVPFARLARGLGRTERETAMTLTPPQRAMAVKVSWAVQAAARHVPFGFVCLPQALAARRMLRRRRLSSTLYFGVALTRSNKDAMLAHAWLRAGDKILTGEIEAAQHVVVAKFADDCS